MIACLVALPIGLGEASAQAKVSSAQAQVVSDPSAVASAAAAKHVPASKPSGLHSTRSELHEARHALKHAESMLRSCRHRDRRACVAARRTARDASVRERRLRHRLEGAIDEASLAQHSRERLTYPSKPAAVDAVSTSRKAGGKHRQEPVEGESAPVGQATPKEAPATEQEVAVTEREVAASEQEVAVTEREVAVAEQKVPVVEQEVAASKEAPTNVEGSSGSTASTFEPGLDSGTNLELDVEGAETLKAKLVRIEFPVGDTPSQMEPVIAAYARVGIRVLPLAGFYGSMPTSAQARGLAAWASAFGPGGSFWAGRSDGDLAIQDIEVGNETSYGYQYGDNAGEPSYQARARTYAIRVKEAAEAIDGTSHHVGVLAQEDDWTGDWANGMFEAVPNLGSYVAGWTIHPYGPDWEGRIQDLIKQTASHGAPASIPIDITEWGLATDNGRCLTDNYEWNPCMTYEEAGNALTRTVSTMRQTLGSRFGIFIVYQVRDQQPSTASTNEREAYFGALQHELEPKGAFTTAVEQVLAGN